MSVQPGPQPQPIDMSNPFIGEYPASLSTVVMQTQQGPRLALTVRCGNATVTVLLGRDDSLAWAAQIEREAEHVSTLIIPSGPLNPGMNGGMQ